MSAPDGSLASGATEAAASSGPTFLGALRVRTSAVTRAHKPLTLPSPRKRGEGIDKR